MTDVMTYIVDIVLVGLLVIMAVRGCVQGFLKTILKSGRFFLAVLLTVALTSPVAALLNDNLINPPIYSAVNGKLTELADAAEGSADSLLESVPAFLKNQLGENISTTGKLEQLVDEWSETISQSISGAISTVLAVILLFVALMLLLTILIKILSSVIEKIKLLDTVNRVLGLVLGLLVGGALMLLAARVVAPILTALGQDALVDSSFILKLLG